MIDGSWSVYTLHGGEFSFVWLKRGVFATRNPIVITSGSPRPSRERRENGNSLSLPWHRTSTRALLSHAFSLSFSSPPFPAPCPDIPFRLFFCRPVRTRSTHTYRWFVSRTVQGRQTRDTCSTEHWSGVGFPNLSSACNRASNRYRRSTINYRIFYFIFSDREDACLSIRGIAYRRTQCLRIAKKQV